jgi:hypothetical protein
MNCFRLQVFIAMMSFHFVQIAYSQSFYANATARHDTIEILLHDIEVDQEGNVNIFASLTPTTERLTVFIFSPRELGYKADIRSGCGFWYPDRPSSQKRQGRVALTGFTVALHSLIDTYMGMGPRRDGYPWEKPISFFLNLNDEREGEKRTIVITLWLRLCL